MGGSIEGFMDMLYALVVNANGWTRFEVFY